MRRNVFTTYDPNLPMGKKFVAVHVQNEDPLYFLVEVKSKVCELFVQISKFLNLLEPELFGLAIKSSETFIFLDPLEKLCKYAPKSWKTQNNGMDNDGLPLFNVFFRVQFYVDSYLFISDKVAKFYYYHQLRENVLHYDQSMCEERAFLLASYALQADYGNYNPKIHKNRYFDPSNYFPEWVIEELGIEYIQRHLPSLHCDHKGMSKSEAQSMFIREASDPTAAHNFHLYKMVSNKKGSTNYSTDTWLAITITGLIIYSADPSVTKSYRRLKTRISFFPWSDIGKLSFDKKKFEIRSTGPQSRKFVYYTGSEELARFLLWFSRASHQFHLMVLPKMKEMLKREAEINRRKYRENCISSTSSRTSSSGNSSGTGMSNSNPASNNTSKSVSPFEFSSAASNSSDPKKGTSDLDISSSSVCCGMDMDGDSKSEDQDQQRVSVISNASSNTTSGIASEKMLHGLGEDSDRDDLESDLLMSLNHHNHHAMPGCSPQPVVSMESLALSEPIDHHRSCHHQNHHHHHHHQQQHHAAKSMMRNKKHSISISNIMITSTEGSGSVESSCSPTQHQIKATVNTSSYQPKTTGVVVNVDKSPKISLCLNINEQPKSNEKMKDNNNIQDSDFDDNNFSNDEIDSVFDHNQRYQGSGKSNVTVLSTILKPEAERLLKQGLEADNVASELLDQFINDDGIDSLELAELKEFEKAEKEKIILNSLIDNIPPPPTSMNSSDSESSDSSSSESDLSDDEDININEQQKSLSKLMVTRISSGHHYSPLNEEEEKCFTNHYNTAASSSPSNKNNNNLSSGFHSKSSCSSISSELNNNNIKTSISVQNKFPINHIYENIPVPGSKYSQMVQALVTTPHKHNSEFPPTVPLRPYPSLNSVPFQGNYIHRTGMKIGVSSLSRPTQKAAVHFLQGRSIYSNSNKINNNMGALNFGPPLLNSSNLCAGSEPNLYFGGFNNHPNKSNNIQAPLSSNKCDSVYDCRPIGEPLIFTESTPKIDKPELVQAPIAFRQFIKNQIGSSPNESPKLMLDLSMLKQPLQQTMDDQAQNHHSTYITPPPSADYHKKSSISELQLSPSLTKMPSQQMSNNLSPKSNSSEEESKSPKKSKESRLKELRQRTSDLNLPLITALFNDSTLTLSDRFMDQPKSQSMQHLTPPSSNYQVNNGSSSGCSSLSSTPSRASPATVERSCTFRVDEAIAKSALRQQQKNDANNNIHQSLMNHQNFNKSYHQNNIRPISWHVNNNNYGSGLMMPATKVINQQNNSNLSWRYFSNTPTSNQQQQRSSIGSGPLVQSTNLHHHQLYHHRSEQPATIWIDSPMTTS